MTSIAWIRRTYGVPAFIRRRVVFDGKPGRIVWTSGPHLLLRLDGQRGKVATHPMWRMDYLDGEGQR